MSFKETLNREFPVEWNSLENEVSDECLELLENKVDVVVCTYNSERYLFQCLESIVKNVPVKNLWLVDNYSKDKTCEIANLFNAKIVQSRCGLAEARKLSFDLATTQLFVNVDSDVVLCKGWYNKLSRFFNKKVGCVCGITVDQHPLQKAYLESMWKMRDAASYDILHLPNAIFRKEAVKDLVLPKGLLGGAVASEDEAIKDFIVKKGYKVINVPVFSKHYSYPPLINNKTYWYGAGARVAKQIKFKSILVRFVLSFPQALYSAFVMRNSRLIGYCIKYRFQILYGFLHPEKYFNLKRKPQ